MAENYRQGDPIPRLEYTEDEVRPAVVRVLINMHTHSHDASLCRSRRGA